MRAHTVREIGIALGITGFTSSSKCQRSWRVPYIAFKHPIDITLHEDMSEHDIRSLWHQKI